MPKSSTKLPLKTTDGGTDKQTFVEWLLTFVEWLKTDKMNSSRETHVLNGQTGGYFQL